MSDVVLLETLPTACGRRFGLATLNAPAGLNALSLPMIRALAAALEAWAEDAGVVGVVLGGAGERAFCAGGDLRALYPALTPGTDAPSSEARAFFAEEYALDHRIHTYEKPILCWGHGIVMGGGIGLMSGASHRVVTRESRLAMPEISIGLYPDVGGSWLLRHLPGRVGLFLALTGVSINAADALFCGLADFALEAQQRADLLEQLAGARWSDSSRTNGEALSRMLSARSLHDLPESPVRRHLDLINSLVAGEDLLAISARLHALRTDDPWLQSAVATFAKGSPTSVALAFELWRRARHLSLAQVFRLEHDVSLHCCTQPEFAEGIRALLIDKDRKPRWQPALLADVSAEVIEAHFRRSVETHPLARLGT